MVNRAPAKRRSPARPRAAPPPEPARVRLQLDERRARLIELGRTLFNERSYDDISIDDIAAAAGISKGLLYHYFPSKRHFYVEGVRAAAQEMMRLTDAREEHLPALDRLQLGLDAYLDYVQHNARAYASLLRSGVGVDVQVAAVVEHTRKVMAERLLRGLGIVAPRPAMRLACRGWIGFVEAVSLEWIDSGRDLAREAVRAMLIAALQSALGTATELDPQSAPPAVRSAAPAPADAPDERLDRRSGPPPLPPRRRG